MKYLWLTTLLALGLSVQAARSQYCSPVFHQPLPLAPDACGPGFYSVGPYGMVYGPNYYLRPWCPPYQMPLFQQAGAQGASPQGPNMGGPAAFPTHPYARSPRDFFMWTEVQEELTNRERMPLFVP
jgi:hypothetical protein